MVRYKEDGNKDFKHVKEELNFLYKILLPYNYEVIILAYRGFKSIDLFEFIDKTLKWKYCIRCTKDIKIFIDDKSKIKKLEDILTLKNNRAKYFYDINITSKKYTCNMAVCKEETANDTWYIANNIKKDLILKKCSKILKGVVLIWKILESRYSLYKNDVFL